MEDGPEQTPVDVRQRDSMPWDVARRRAHAIARPLAAVSRPLSEADGCVLGTPLVSPVAVPPVDRAAMDGYAVRGAGPWRIIGHVAAGTADPGALEDGQATGIVTGAALPAGATSVVRSEDAVVTGPALPAGATSVVRSEDAIVTGPALPAGTTSVVRAEDAVVIGDRLEGPSGEGRHIRRTGEECRPGDQVLPAGVVVGPAVLGLAATIGLDHLTVLPPPTVAALITGDELVQSGPSAPGRVRDAIGPMLPGLITRAGATNAVHQQLPDSRAALTSALRESTADLVLVSGSSAAGPADHLRPALTALGAELIVDGVACRPGHPQALAQLPDARLVLGLPGNPFAALVAFLTLGVPAITGMRGLPLPELASIAVPGGIACHPTSTRLVPVHLTPQGAVPIGHGGAAMLRGPAAGDALAVVAPGPAEAITARLLPLDPAPAGAIAARLLALDPGARPWGG